MANHKSALKRVRQSEKRRVRNRVRKTRIKNLVKETRLAASERPEQAADVLKDAIRTIDKAASKGTLHRRTAARKIGRLSRHVFKAQSGDSA